MQGYPPVPERYLRGDHSADEVSVGEEAKLAWAPHVVGVFYTALSSRQLRHVVLSTLCTSGRHTVQGVAIFSWLHVPWQVGG